MILNTLTASKVHIFLEVHNNMTKMTKSNMTLLGNVKKELENSSYSSDVNIGPMSIPEPRVTSIKKSKFYKHVICQALNTTKYA